MQIFPLFRTAAAVALSGNFPVQIALVWAHTNLSGQREPNHKRQKCPKQTIRANFSRLLIKRAKFPGEYWKIKRRQSFRRAGVA